MAEAGHFPDRCLMIGLGDVGALSRCEETDGIFRNVNFVTEADLIQQYRALPSHGSGLYRTDRN
jgi:hypothetical protein